MEVKMICKIALGTINYKLEWITLL